MILFYDMKSNLYVFILKCVSSITNIRTLMEGVIKKQKNRTSRKQTKKKQYLKDCMEHFFNFSYKNIIHDKIILFDAKLLVQKMAMRAGYAERSIN